MSRQFEMHMMGNYQFLIKRAENGYIIEYLHSDTQRSETHVTTDPQEIGNIISRLATRDRLVGGSNVPPMSDLMGPPC